MTREWIKKRIYHHEAEIGKALMFKGKRKHSETVPISERIEYHEEKLKELREKLEEVEGDKKRL